MRALERLITAILLAVVLAGSAAHVGGRVVDIKGGPVSGARVKIEGIYGGMLIGEGAFSVQAVTDCAGRFTVVLPEVRGDVTATSADGTKKGRAPISKEVTVVLRWRSDLTRQ
ncbi:MAG: hypothetical protein WA183_08690 [Chthoniobacterales bacterium]